MSYFYYFLIYERVLCVNFLEIFRDYNTLFQFPSLVSCNDNLSLYIIFKVNPLNYVTYEYHQTVKPSDGFLFHFLQKHLECFAKPSHLVVWTVGDHVFMCSFVCSVGKLFQESENTF